MFAHISPENVVSHSCEIVATSSWRRPELRGASKHSSSMQLACKSWEEEGKKIQTTIRRKNE